MTGFYGGEPIEPFALKNLGVDAFETGAGSVLAAQAGEAFAANPLPRAVRALATPGAVPEAQTYWQQYRDPAQRNETGDMADIAAQRGDAPTTLSVDDANTQFGIKGVLKFDKPVAETVAQSLYTAKRTSMMRQDIIERRPESVFASMVARGAVDLAVGLLDPINLGIGFIPVVGEARAAGMIARASGALERSVVRAGIGATQGAAGMAMLEPLNAVLDWNEHNDWKMSEALRNIAFGGVLGGGLHVATAHPRSSFGAFLETLPHEDREALLRTALAQHVAEQATNVAPVLDIAALKSGFQARMEARGETGMGDYRVYTPDGLSVDVRPEVVEHDKLIVSHNPDGTVNTEYPHAEGMQPRDRSNVASQAQIMEIASRLEPERLGRSAEAGTGAPVVNEAGVVESGNGRMMALRRVYDDPALKDQAAAYRGYIEAAGHDTAGMSKPVLIARRTTVLQPEEAAQFARSANTAPVMTMNAAEQARMDVSRVSKAIVDLKPGSLTAPRNRGFIGSFMAQVGKEDRNALIGSDGRLAPPGVTRIRAAVLAHAYGDALGPTLEHMLADETAHMRGLAGALNDVAPLWAQFRAAVARGDVPANLDITPALGEAVQFIDRARKADLPLPDLLSQQDMLGGPSPAAEALLRGMFQDPAMRRPIGREKLEALLHGYVEQAMEAKAGPGLPGLELPPTTPADILGSLGRDDARVAAIADRLKAAIEDTELPEQKAASEAAGEAAAAVKSSHVGTGAEATMPPRAAETRPTETMLPSPNDPHIARLAVEQAERLKLLYRQAVDAKPDFDAALTQIADSVGGEVQLAPLKGTSRAVAKIEADYGGDASRIKDLLRATIVVDTPEQAVTALTALEGRLKVLDSGRRDFIRGEPGPDGYRDIKVNVQAGDGLIAEVQINLHDMLTAKNEAHALYEEKQALVRKIEKEDREPTDEEAAAIAALNARQNTIYAAAFEGARTRRTIDQKSGGDNGVPLRHAEDGSNGRGGSVSQAAQAHPEPDGGVTPSGTSAERSTSETGISPSISKNSAIAETPPAVGAQLSGEIKAHFTPEIQEAIRLASDAEAALHAEVAAGRMTEAELQPLLAANEAIETAESNARAYEAAASCLIAGGLGL